jgi:hypothetical protein
VIEVAAEYYEGNENMCEKNEDNGGDAYYND